MRALQKPVSRFHSSLINGTSDCLAAGNTDNANKVAEKLEELSVKDKESGETKKGDKTETEKKKEEGVKNWNPRTGFADRQLISFPLFLQ